MSTPRQPPATCLQNDPVNSAEAQYNSVAPESQLLNLLEESHRGCKPRRVCFLSKGWVLLERYHCLIVPYYWASRWSWLLVVCRLLMSNSPGWAEIPWCCFCSQSKKLCCFLQYDASVQITLVPTKIGWHIYIYTWHKRVQKMEQTAALCSHHTHRLKPRKIPPQLLPQGRRPSPPTWQAVCIPHWCQSHWWHHQP